MRKNRTMRVAAVLLLAVLLTVCAICATFAKYTTNATGSDTARVAKWGFNTASISIDGLFRPTYTHVAADDSTTNVIAPGTSGNVSFKFELVSGVTAPEVAYDFAVSTDGSNCDTPIQSNDNIQWALTTSDTAPAAGDSEWGTWTALLNEIKALSGDSTGTKQYAANSKPAMVNTPYYVYWMWDFDAIDSTAANTDTAMGNNISDLADVTLKITITATQVD